MQLLLNIYFETKYILFLFQLFEERSKVDLDEAAQVVWDTLSPAAMSDQEFDDEKQIHVNRTIPWRSEIVTNLIKQIDISFIGGLAKVGDNLKKRIQLGVGYLNV